MKNSKKTKDWALYEAGKNYNNQMKPNYYHTVDANIAFFNDDQWRNLKADNMPKPVFNIMKRVIQFQVAALTSSKTAIHFEPLLNVADGTDPNTLTPSHFANSAVENLLEKLKMDFRIKDALFDAAKTGDACAHFYWDTDEKPFGNQSEAMGEICMELVDGTNVFFGNANTTNVEKQPYIIISGRDTVANLQAEAKKYKGANPDGATITADKENFWEASHDASIIEVDSDESGKALYIIVYRKDPDTKKIFVSKSVRNTYIYKDIDTGLNRYPVAWMNWLKRKNNYHGIASASGIMANQIFINRMFAMVMYHLMMTAFPKAVYNADIIAQWDNSIGSAIPIVGIGPEQNITNIAGYLQPGNMSNQIMQVIEQTMGFTKEMLGVSDAALGQVDPKNTSAIIAVQKSTAVPLENPKANMYEWVEDIGRILFDMMGTYYGERPVVVEVEGQNQQMMFDFSVFKDEWLKVRADVGESSYWSQIASLQTLDNLLMNQKIEFVDYLERVPEEYIPQKQQLIDKIKDQMQQQQEQQMAQANDPNALLSQMSPEEQKAFSSASPEQQRAVMAQMQQATQQMASTQQTMQAQMQQNAAQGPPPVGG